ncbi:MAG: hypothetical protein JWO08_1602 [Verrucomicrobiaceae bacterium]|nr:hypothetical protein [Verrucomicrobiaceae bacterium]
MPNVQFVCPHCEKHSEVQVASVTRTRACPHCGYNVLLQVPGSEPRTSRRALLVTPSKDEPLPVGAQEHMPGTPAYLPKPLEGDAFERMKADPEIHAIRKQLISGFLVLGMLIAGAIVWHFVEDNALEGQNTPSVAAAETQPAVILQPSAPVVSSTLGEGMTNPTATKNGSLTFLTAGGTVHSAPLAPAMAVSQDKAEQARKVLLAFLSADSVDSLLITVAYRPIVEAQLRAYYAEHPLVALRATEIVPVENPLAPANSMTMQVTLSSGRRVQAVVLAPDDRHLGVDWPSFVALSDMEWSQFITSKPTTATLFRVLAEPGDWYANGFGDSSKLCCLKLISPSDPLAEPFFAYTDRQGALGQQMDSLLRGRSGPVPLTLRLKFTTYNEADNQGLLDSLVGSSWVIQPQPSTAQVRR